jgi:hypothetical protein
MRQKRDPLLSSGAFQSEVAAWLNLIADDVTRESLNLIKELMKQGLIDGPPLGLGQEDADKKLKEWVRPIAKESLVTGYVVAGKAVNSFFFKTTLPSILARQSRSHKGSLANKSSNRKMNGPPRAPWRNAVKKMYSDKRRRPLSLDVFIDALVHDLVIEEKDDGSFYDMASGKQIAPNMSQLKSAISTMKTEMQKPRPAP